MTSDMTPKDRVLLRVIVFLLAIDVIVSYGGPVLATGTIGDLFTAAAVYGIAIVLGVYALFDVSSVRDVSDVPDETPD